VSGDSLTLKGIADLLGNWQPPKLVELHCHPDVANWLRLTAPEAKQEFPFTGSIGVLTGIPVFEEPEFDDGNWELREDGLAVSSGHVDVPYLARRIKLEFREPF
jgi:hypothetical protein